MQYLNTLAGDLLDIGRMQTWRLILNLKPVVLNEAVEQAVETAQLLADNQRIVVELPGKALLVNSDAQRLSQILFNLLTNAVRYAPASAEIRVRLRQRGKNAELEVQDDGPGIPATTVTHIFERFYHQGRPEEQQTNGLGLGLYITRQLVTAHGGTIAVASPEGSGATFTVTLPLIAS